MFRLSKMRHNNRVLMNKINHAGLTPAAIYALMKVSMAEADELAHSLHYAGMYSTSNVSTMTADERRRLYYDLVSTNCETAVFALESGVVTVVNKWDGESYPIKSSSIVIESEDFRLKYSRVAAPVVSIGQNVMAGDAIGWALNKDASRRTVRKKMKPKTSPKSFLRQKTQISCEGRLYRLHEVLSLCPSSHKRWFIHELAKAAKVQYRTVVYWMAIKKNSGKAIPKTKLIKLAKHLKTKPENLIKT
jgi:hypothetical protein